MIHKRRRQFRDDQRRANRNHAVHLSSTVLTFTGRPQPDVSWFMNGILVDDEYEHNSGNIIENRLLWPSLQRQDLYSVFTCRASNTKAVAPRERRLVLDMYRKHPLASLVE